MRKADAATDDERVLVYTQTNDYRNRYHRDFGVVPPAPAFDLFDAERAADEWRFNCGPSSICVLSGMTPEQIRPKMLDFERKGYTNPTLMFDVLRGLGASWRKHSAGWPAEDGRYLVRVQWGGPWCDDGVPVAARYRHTHWIAHWIHGKGCFIFDVNAMCVGGWLTYQEWHNNLAPWLIKQCEPKGNGKFWPTHCLEVMA